MSGFRGVFYQDHLCSPPPPSLRTIVNSKDLVTVYLHDYSKPAFPTQISLLSFQSVYLVASLDTGASQTQCGQTVAGFCALCSLGLGSPGSVDGPVSARSVVPQPPPISAHPHDQVTESQQQSLSGHPDSCLGLPPSSGSP